MTKIEEPLNRRIKREETVVYIFVQIYKILETNNERENYPVLEFFRNWVVHHELDRNNAKRVLEEYIEKSAKMKYHFLSFETLREEMDKFLNNHNLPQFIVNEGWFQFRGRLVEVIRDQPVLKNSTYTPNNECVYLKELRITKPPEEFKRDLITFDLILSDNTNIGGSIMLGDQDKMAKKYNLLNNVWFRHHYNRKAFLRIGEIKRNTSDEDVLFKLNRKYESLYKQLKRDEKAMATLRNEIAQDEFNDKYYA